MAVASPTVLDWQITYPAQWALFRDDPSHPENPVLLDSVSRRLAAVGGGGPIADGIVRWALSGALAGDESFDVACVGMHPKTDDVESMLVVGLAGYRDGSRLTDGEEDRPLALAEALFGWDTDDAVIDRVDLPAGPAVRLNVIMGRAVRANSSDGKAKKQSLEPQPSAFVVVYDIDPPDIEGSVWLLFVTPNWKFAPQLLELFDAIAKTVAVTKASSADGNATKRRAGAKRTS
jgi:hypothetical protein